MDAVTEWMRFNPTFPGDRFEVDDGDVGLGWMLKLHLAHIIIPQSIEQHYRPSPLRQEYNVVLQPPGIMELHTFIYSHNITIFCYCFPECQVMVRNEPQGASLELFESLV